MYTAIHWFRNDLRVDDNEALNLAVRRALHAGRQGRLLPVYVLEPAITGKTPLEFPATGPFRARFLLETLQALRQALRQKGSDLLTIQGLPEEVLPELVRQHGARLVTWHCEPAHREQHHEQQVAARLQTLGAETGRCWGPSLLHPHDLPFDPWHETPDVFTRFRRKVEKRVEIREPVNAPDAYPPLPDALRHPGSGTLDSISHPPEYRFPEYRDFGVEPPIEDDRSVLRFTGGEQAALERMEHYFWTTGRLASYKEERNGLLGADYSSKFSPWLANGSLSPRRVWHEVQRFEKERVKNDSTYWLVFELLWRDYFRFVMMKHGKHLFSARGIASVSGDNNAEASGGSGPDAPADHLSARGSAARGAADKGASAKGFAARGAADKGASARGSAAKGAVAKGAAIGISGSDREGTRFIQSHGLDTDSALRSVSDRDRQVFEHWRTGTTGVRFVDANMRELLLTGFMSNRGRQNVASWLAKTRYIDWRLGAWWFESQLIDYDVYSNWGNWAYVSGTGNDPRDRVFDVERQERMYDPQGLYVRHWLGT